MLFRLVLLVNLPGLLYQLTRLRQDQAGDSWRGVLLIAVILVVGALFVISLLRPALLGDAFAPTLRRMQQYRLTAWGALLLIFAGFTVLAALMAPASNNNAEPLRVLSGINSLAWIYAVYWRTSRPELTWESPTLPSKRRDLLIAALIFGLALGMSLWQMLDAGPVVSDDTRFYFAVSEQIMGHDLVRTDTFPGFQWFSPFSYSFALAMSATRTLADTPVSLIVLQHLLRALTAALTFWLLRHLSLALAIFAGILVALASPTLHLAQMVLSDSFYATSLHLFTLFMLLMLTRSRQVSLPVVLLTGILCGLTAWMRPAGVLLILVPAALLILNRWWMSLALLLAGLAVSVLAISAGRWVIDRQFTLMPSQSDVYFYVPLFYNDPVLYSPDNGPVSRKFYDYCFSPELSPPVLPYECSYHYRQLTGEKASLSTVYLEAIQAQPAYFLSIVVSGVKIFIGDFIEPWTPGYSSAKVFPQAKSLLLTPPPRVCTEFGCDFPFIGTTDWGVDRIYHDYYQYAYVHTYQVRQTSDNRPFALYSRLFLPVMQPNLLAGQFSSAFYGWVVMMVVLLLETRHHRAVFYFVILNALIILYHAFVTVGANIVTYRYVYVVTPHFIFLASLVYLLVLRAALEYTRAARLARSSTLPEKSLQNV